MFDSISDEPPKHVSEPAGPSKDALRNMLKTAVLNTGGVEVKENNRRAGEDRRFVDKAELDPGSVRSLPQNHPALVENRTLFPSTVVEVNDSFEDRLLVSGKNNRKLGERILKGKFKGYALYGLSLEERATCPTDCSVRTFCYGNGMQMARRHRITDLDLFATFLEDEIRTILADPVDGLMVRLHVLGDFPSVEYVALWADLMEAHERLACYGYTHRRDDIGDAINSLKSRYPDRFRIRWSHDKPHADGAVVIDRIPEGKRVEEGLVCPAQTDATACCSSCGLCWEGHAKKETIVFIKHGPKSLAAFAESARQDAPAMASEGIRPIAAFKIAQKRDLVLSRPPELRIVNPVDLRVEPAYQRDLSGRSMKLIRKLVTGWDWAKFKPPICAETPEGLFIVDGQHTAIAAASHPEIQTIPVMVVSAERIERRAEAFVSHNRDRLVMTPSQVFYGEVAAGNSATRQMLEVVTRAGAAIPRIPVPKGYAKPGQITAMDGVRKVFAVGGAELLERVIRIAALSKVAPISKTIIIGIQFVLTEKPFADVPAMHDARIAAAVASIKNIEAASQHYAAETWQSRFRAAAGLIYRAAVDGKVAA